MSALRSPYGTQYLALQSYLACVTTLEQTLSNIPVNTNLFLEIEVTFRSGYSCPQTTVYFNGVVAVTPATITAGTVVDSWRKITAVVTTTVANPVLKFQVYNPTDATLFLTAVRLYQ